MARKKTYTQTVEELESILHSLEENKEVDMDAIAEKVKQASELIRQCKTKLHTIDKDLEKIISDLSEE